jgi:hypothetical protein
MRAFAGNLRKIGGEVSAKSDVLEFTVQRGVTGFRVIFE